jgi:hypothetical protein
MTSVRGRPTESIVRVGDLERKAVRACERDLSFIPVMSSFHPLMRVANDISDRVGGHVRIVVYRPEEEA